MMNWKLIVDPHTATTKYSLKYEKRQNEILCRILWRVLLYVCLSMFLMFILYISFHHISIHKIRKLRDWLHFDLNWSNNIWLNYYYKFWNILFGDHVVVAGNDDDFFHFFLIPLFIILLICYYMLLFRSLFGLLNWKLIIIHIYWGGYIYGFVLCYMKCVQHYFGFSISG